MGSILCSDSREIGNPIYTYLSSHNFQRIVVKSSDPIYLSPELYKSTSDPRTFASLSRVLKSQAKFLKIDESLDRYQKQKHDNIIQLAFYSEIPGSTSLFLRKHNVGMVFEYHYYTLLQLLEAIARKLEKFMEEEIWYIMRSLLNAVRFLNENKGFHNNLKLDTVAVDFEGMIKIMPNHVQGKKARSFFQMKDYLTRDFDYCYLHPRVLKRLNEDKPKKIEKGWKIDIFAIGILGLELCTLKNAKSCFDFEKLELDFQKFSLFLESAKDIYSKEIMQFLEKIIRTDIVNDTFLQDRLIEIDELKNAGIIKVGANLKASLDKITTHDEMEERK